MFLLVFMTVIQYFVTHSFCTGKAGTLDMSSAVASLTYALPVSLPLKQRQGLWVFYPYILIICTTTVCVAMANEDTVNPSDKALM